MAEVHRVRSDALIKFSMRRQFISTSLADLHQLDERYGAPANALTSDEAARRRSGYLAPRAPGVVRVLDGGPKLRAQPRRADGDGRPP